MLGGILAPFLLSASRVDLANKLAFYVGCIVLVSLPAAHLGSTRARRRVIRKRFFQSHGRAPLRSTVLASDAATSIRITVVMPIFVGMVAFGAFGISSGIVGVIPVAVTAIVVIIGLVTEAALNRVQRIKERAIDGLFQDGRIVCLECGYEVTWRLSERCPECGKAIHSVEFER